MPPNTFYGISQRNCPSIYLPRKFTKDFVNEFLYEFSKKNPKVVAKAILQETCNVSKQIAESAPKEIVE